MILVADSGSTNTDWVIIQEKEILSSFQTKGFHPFFIKSNEICNELQLKFPIQFNPNEIKKIFFYGAGCSSEKMKSIVSEGIKQFFTHSMIEIEHDMLAAARALFMNDEGIAVILGTGANTCFYNGEEITKNITSLGYILGDEGGGDYLGKLFITDFLNEELPQEIHEKFIKQFNLSKTQILHAVYTEPHPNRFLASFSEFIHDQLENDYIDKLVKKTFRDLFNKHICLSLIHI